VKMPYETNRLETARRIFSYDSWRTRYFSLRAIIELPVSPSDDTVTVME